MEKAKKKKMKCTLVRQLPNHCGPACLESIAKDNGINVTQTQFVVKYPDVFGDNGVLNDLGKSINLETVIRDLGLSQNIYRQPYVDFAQLKELSKSNEILLLWTKVSKHCVRFCGYDPDDSAITIMDPEFDKLQKRKIHWLDDISPDLVYFKKI